MESPLRPVLAEIFMVHLKRRLMPKLEKFMKFWKRYVVILSLILDQTSSRMSLIF